MVRILDLLIKIGSLAREIFLHIGGYSLSRKEEVSVTTKLEKIEIELRKVYASLLNEKE